MAANPAGQTPFIHPDGVINAENYTWKNIREVYWHIPGEERSPALRRIAALKAQEFPDSPSKRLAYIIICFMALGIGAVLMAKALNPRLLPSMVLSREVIAILGATMVVVPLIPLYELFTEWADSRALAKDKKNNGALLRELIAAHNQQYLSRNP